MQHLAVQTCIDNYLMYVLLLFYVADWVGHCPCVHSGIAG